MNNYFKAVDITSIPTRIHSVTGPKLVMEKFLESHAQACEVNWENLKYASVDKALVSYGSIRTRCKFPIAIIKRDNKLYLIRKDV